MPREAQPGQNTTRMEKLGIDKSDLQNVEVPADIMAGIMKILACEEPQEVPEAKPPVSQPPKEPAPVIDVDKQLFPDLKQVYGADGAPDAAAGEEHDVPAEASEEGYSSLLGDGGDEWGDFCEPEAAELEGGEPEGCDDGEWQQCEEATPIETEQWQQCEQDLQWPAPAEASSVLESEQWQDETTVEVSAANCASGCTSVQYEIGSANEWSIVADLATCLITNLCRTQEEPTMRSAWTAPMADGINPTLMCCLAAKMRTAVQNIKQKF